MVYEIKNAQEFKKAIDESNITFVEFYAKWCGACKLFSAVLDEINEKYQNDKGVKLYKLDVEEAMDVASENNVTATPTLIFYFQGKEIWRFVGYLDYDSLNEKISRLMQEHHA